MSVFGPGYIEIMVPSRYRVVAMFDERLLNFGEDSLKVKQLLRGKIVCQ